MNWRIPLDTGFRNSFHSDSDHFGPFVRGQLCMGTLPWRHSWVPDTLFSLFFFFLPRNPAWWRWNFLKYPTMKTENKWLPESRRCHLIDSDATVSMIIGHCASSIIFAPTPDCSKSFRCVLTICLLVNVAHKNGFSEIQLMCNGRTDATDRRTHSPSLLKKIQHRKTTNKLLNCEFAMKTLLHNSLLFIRYLLLSVVFSSLSPKLNCDLTFFTLLTSTFKKVWQSSDIRCVMVICSHTCHWIDFQVP